IRAGAQEALRCEIARRVDRAGRRHGKRHPRQRRIPGAPRRRAGAAGGRGGGGVRGQRVRVNLMSAPRSWGVKAAPGRVLGRTSPARSGYKFGAMKPTPRSLPTSIDATLDLLAAADYLADRSLATVLFLALKMGRPLFLEGEAGVGKTEIAKVLSSTLG